MKDQTLLSFANFFSAIHFFLVVYVMAPYLATLMPANVSGIALSLGAIVTLSTFPFMPKLVARQGAQPLAILFAGLEFLILILLASSPSPLLAVLLIALACATSPLLAYQLDLLLEASVEDEATTGRVRTTFLTAGNIALVLTPLLIGLLLGTGNQYPRVFMVAALSLIPFVFLMIAKRLPRPETPKMHSLTDACLCIANDTDLRAVALANAVLQFFYHLAPIFIPLYLHTVLFIPWSTLGWMFAIMLVPFVLLEYPAGYLADKKMGDKFFLAVGFVIIGLSFAALGIVGVGTPLWVILAILITTRIGAALVEAMAEGHFFRRVTEEDTNTVSVFRMMRPMGALIAPIIGTLLLSSIGYAGLFFVSGFLILITGFVSSLSIRAH